MVKVTICGVCGKMGKRIAALASRDPELAIAGATEIQGCSLIGVNLGDELKTHNLGVAITAELDEAMNDADCVIDFTIPAATMENVKIAIKHSKPIVIGTTGFKDAEIEEIKKASENIPVLLSPNMSLGVNVVFGIVAGAAKKLGAGYAVNLNETHHVHKKDKPSGTGKHLAEIIKKARPDLKEVSIESFREGEVVGDHKVVFESEFDTIVISHSAKTRDIFALGALMAAKFLVGKKNGLYAMKDVLEAI